MLPQIDSLETLCLILLSGLVGLWVTWRFKIPDIVFYLLLGMGLGSSGLGLLTLDPSSSLYQLLLLFGTALLLFEGGVHVKLGVLRQVWRSVLALASLGVLICAGVIAWGVHLYFGLNWLCSCLVGAVLAPTDPATLIPVFRFISIRAKVQQTVIAESAANDATGSILAMSLLAMLTATQSLSWWHCSGLLLWETLAGGAGGVLVAWLFLRAIVAFQWLRGHEPFVLPLVICLAYLFASQLLPSLGLPSASAYMSVFCAGIAMGNGRNWGFHLPKNDDREMRSLLEHYSVLMRMLLFLFLGAQVNFDLLREFGFSTLVIAGLLIFVARPLTVILCCVWDRSAKWKINELRMMCWTRETGVIPAALASIINIALVQTHQASLIQFGKLLTAITFCSILTTLLVQVPTTPYLVRRLNLEEKS